MSEHVITVVEKFKMDAREKLYSWACSCGRAGDSLWGYPGAAERAGLRHKRDKEAAA
jgi:hypothetical protein